MTNPSLRLVLAQIKTRVGDIVGNADKVLASAAEAIELHQAQLVVFPELTITGYPPEDLLLRAGFRKRVKEQLQRICDANLPVDILVGLPWEEQGKIYNAAFYIAHGEVVGRYFKRRLPNYSVFDEKRYFEPGDQALVVERHGAKIGITLCEDIWAAEPAADTAAAGADFIVNLNASPFHMAKNAEREQVLRARMQETGLPIAYVNLVGGQDELVFDGRSLVCNRDGVIDAVGAPCEEQLIPVACEVDSAGQWIMQAAAVLDPNNDGEEPAVYQALVRGVRDYVNDNGFPGVVIGLSGGIDSALTLAIAVDALGADRVEAVMMPSRYTADISVNDARKQAETMGVHYHEIVIGPLTDAFATALSDRFAGLEEDTTEENIQARSRGVLLMAISNKSGRMVLTTGNKSEMAVGYATLYGDMAGGFAPLKDIFKTLVYQLAVYRNTISEVIPTRVITRPPSAELRDDQKDSDSLPEYDVLDPILQGYVEEDRSFESLVEQGFDPAEVGRIALMVRRNEYKRRQAPPGVRVSRRAFGKDRRYPISSGYGQHLSG